MSEPGCFNVLSRRKGQGREQAHVVEEIAKLGDTACRGMSGVRDLCQAWVEGLGQRDSVVVPGFKAESRE